MQSAAGTLVGQHRLLRPLADMRGGELWLVETGMTKTRRAVLRFVPPELLGGRAAHEEFARGLDAAVVHSPHVARAVDRGVDRHGRAFVVYALDAGETLRALLLRERRLSIALACEIVRQAALGLSALHAAQRTHRDVRPDTLFVGDGMQVALLDAGIRTAIHRRDVADHLEEHVAFAALAPYSSPERLSGKPVTRHVDIWSLAVIAHELFTGGLPFSADVPAALRGVFARAFHRDPSERFQSAQHFVDALRDALEMDDELLAEAREHYLAPAAPEPHAKPDNRNMHRALLTHVLAAALGASIAGAYLLGREQSATALPSIPPFRSHVRVTEPARTCEPCEVPVVEPAPQTRRTKQDEWEPRPDYGF